MADYERRWIEEVVGSRGGGFDYVESERDLHELELFIIEDGVPLGLKAILFNRYCHWSSYNTINDFKDWYVRTYLRRKDKE